MLTDIAMQWLAADLRSHELHAERATIQDVSAAQHRVDRADERRVEGEGVLEGEGEEDVVLALPLLQRGQVSGQGRVSVHPTDFHIPLIQRVIDKLNL